MSVQSAQNRLNLFLSAADSDHPLVVRQFPDINGDDAVFQRGLAQIPLNIKEISADVPGGMGVHQFINYQRVKWIIG